MSRTIVTLALIVAALLLSSAAAAQDTPFASCKNIEPIRTRGQESFRIEGRNGALRFIYQGTPVVIVCDDTILQANRIEWDSDTHAIRAEGDVTLQQPTVTISAERADLDGNTKLGTFYKAVGQASIGSGPEKKSPFGTIEPDVIFWGEKIEKITPTSFTLEQGGFTTCAQPTPRWEMNVRKATLVMDKHAFMQGVVLKVKDVPLLYLPAFYYPMDKEGRSTGFLLPTYGSSSFDGTIFSNAFFWAINRSQDATFSHDWSSKSGQGAQAEYRYVRSVDSRGNALFHIREIPEILTTSGESTSSARRSITISGDANQWLPGGYRLNSRINYFTDSATQQLYQDVYTSPQRQMRSYYASLTGGLGRARLNAYFNQDDSFYGADVQRVGRLPAVNIALPDRAIGRSRVYVGTTGDLSYLVNRTEPGDPTTPITDSSLWRLDSTSRVSAPLSSLSFLTVRADASWRLTRWAESLDVTDPTNSVQVPVGLTRQFFTMAARATGPTFSRIYQRANGKYADAFKHVIEPTFSISRTTAFKDSARIVRNDYIDQQVPSLTQVDYGISNKILARRPAAPGPPGSPPRRGVTRQIMSVAITQSYYSDSSAAAVDSQYGQTIGRPVTFSPLTLQANFSPADDAIGDFRLFVDPKVKKITYMNASARVDRERLVLNVTWSKNFKIAELPSAQFGSESLSNWVTIRSRRNTVGGTYSFNYDLENTKWIQQRIMAYYNSQCCGVTFDWQSYGSYSTLPANRTFSVSFTLAGIGAFSNPLGAFGGPGGAR